MLFCVRYSNDRGTTLVEVIVSVIIFSVLMLAGLNFFVFAHSFSSEARREMYAVNMGKSAMEQVQSVSYDQATLLSFNAFYLLNLNGPQPKPFFLHDQAITGPDGTDYSITFNSNETPYGSTFYKQFHFSVTWQTKPPDFNADYDVIIAKPKVD